MYIYDLWPKTQYGGFCNTFDKYVPSYLVVYDRNQGQVSVSGP